MKTAETLCAMALMVACSCTDRLPVLDSGPHPDALGDSSSLMDSAPLTDADLARCVVAARIGTCCLTVLPVSVEEMANDPCLVPYAARGVETPACPSPAHLECEEVACPEMQPLTRLAERGPDGQCVYASECSTVLDCALASDVRHCCACAQPYPAALTAMDDCLFERGDDQKRCVERCDPTVERIACEACLPPPSMTCAVSERLDNGEIKVCRESAPCTCGGGCDPEQYCLQSQGGGMGPDGRECGEPFGLAECRLLCGVNQNACPTSRPHCISIDTVEGCCSDMMTVKSVCCANADANDESDCY